MAISMTHTYAPNTGGIADYVNVCLQHDQHASQIPFSKNVGNAFPKQGLLHYSGYGFAKRGAPLWLPTKIGAERSRIATLGVFFHELYAFGPPWTSAFWLSPVQRRIARRLAELSDFWITNREGSAVWLRRFAGYKPHAVLPVFSNVGEREGFSPIREDKIVVFGGAALRTKTYKSAGNSLFTWAKQQGVAIHDIGPDIDDPKTSSLLRGEGVLRHGRLTPAEVSVHLSSARYGLIAYPVEFAAKSGVYAAYCAHGTCPIVIAKNYVAADGLVAAKNYIPGLDGSLAGFESNAIGAAAWEWYQPHRVAAHLTAIRELAERVSG